MTPLNFSDLFEAKIFKNKQVPLLVPRAGSMAGVGGTRVAPERARLRAALHLRRKGRWQDPQLLQVNQR